MKDDFYKDIEHKRAQKETDDARENDNDKSENFTEDKEPVMKRAARHRPKQEKKEKKNEEKTSPFKDIGQRVTSYVNKEKLGKAKAFFAGRLSSYSKRLKEELNVSKTKLSEIRSKQKNDDNTTKGYQHSIDENGGRKKSIVPIIIGGIIILPITVMLFVMITSNFWPSGTGTEGQVAGGGDEESTSEEDTSENVDEDMQEQKAEMERELAESRSDEDPPDESSGDSSDGEDSGNSDSGNDLGTGDVQIEYSDEEQAELEDAAESAITDKESGDSTDDGESSDEENTERKY